MNGLDDLGASFRAAIEAIEGAQQSIRVVINDRDEAVRLLIDTAEGSTDPLIADAVQFMGTAGESLAEGDRFFENSAESIRQYLAAKGI